VPYESIPQISLGTAALIIFAVCAGYVMLRGMTRMLVGTLVLCASGWIAFLAWQHAPAWSIAWTGQITAPITLGLPLAGFLAAFFLIRLLAKCLVRPFGKPEIERSSTSIITRALRLPLALIPAAMLWLVGAVVVHHAGSIAEIQASSEKSPAGDEPAAAGYTRRLKESVQAALPESWLAWLDPLADPSRINLAKLIAARAADPREPVIDPATGRPIPRAIIVDDPELQNLARDGDFATLLRHPHLTKALEDPQLKALLRNLNL
jgi:hypothetical protein